MPNKPINLTDYFGMDDLAGSISRTWETWDDQRIIWKNQVQELRNYIFATDTRTTSNKKLPWKNSTTMPKLTMIRDTLHAHYMAALFPTDDWFVWQARDRASNTATKVKAITAYMKAKLDQNDFITEMSKLVYDFIDYGNAFATVNYVNDQIKLESGKIEGYKGPTLRRISPFDIVFDPTVENFENSPKITRTILTLGELKARAQNDPALGYDPEVLNKILEKRYNLRQLSDNDLKKIDAFRIDGFGDMSEYWKSDYVELLEFEGDWYDPHEQELYENRHIVVVDRNWILKNNQRNSWLKNTIFHVGWRLRPDNLWAMGPLDNLVGMQYRIDHIENAKADAVDQYIHPIKKIKGYVEEFSDAPGERIYIGEEGDVIFERPDMAFLQYDQEIGFYQQSMEEMAGAPKDLAGIRTPGNKTRYEVQQLENNSHKLFINKVSYFERVFLEKILNAMLDVAVRRVDVSEEIPIRDDLDAITIFKTVKPSDIAGNGMIRPIGARRFQTQERLVKDLTALANSPIGQDPAVNRHISGKRMAQLFEELLGIERFGLVSPNIRIMEEQETQKLVNTAQLQVADEAEIETELGPEDI